MLKEYMYNGHRYQFAEDKVPAGAILFDEYAAKEKPEQEPAHDTTPEDDTTPEEKGKEPKNKQRQVKNK